MLNTIQLRLCSLFSNIYGIGSFNLTRYVCQNTETEDQINCAVTFTNINLSYGVFQIQMDLVIYSLTFIEF